MSTSSSGGGKRRKALERLRKLAEASRDYLPMPSGPAPLEGPLEVVHLFAEAFRARDAAAIGRLFAEDADLVNEVGLWWTSRHSIRRVFKRAFQREFREASIDFDKVSLRRIGTDAAVVLTRWQLTGQIDPDDVPADLRRGVLTFVLQRLPDGTWLIVAAQSTDIVPAADTNLARAGALTATSYVPQVPDLPEGLVEQIGD